jgi:hypothetical protein
MTGPTAAADLAANHLLLIGNYPIDKVLAVP